MPGGNDELIDIISRRRGYLGIECFAPSVVQAMRRIDRAKFIPEEFLTPYVYEDEPVKIGHGQTCSQPSMVAAMATLLELAPGMKVLEIGSGCGYSAAVTSTIISPGGELFSIEIVPELREIAAANLKHDIAAGKAIDFIRGDGSVGLPSNAPYDRIYLSAGVGRYFYEDPFLEQLADGGILLYPEAYGSMFLVKKNGASTIRREYHGVGFVFLRGSNSGFAFDP